MKFFISRGRFFYWLTKAFLSRYKKHLLLGFFGGFILFVVGMRTYPVIAAIFPSTKVIGIVGEYTPTNLPLSIQNLISQGLTSLNSQGEALPSLATSWEIREEGKVYVFRLREDIFWHDNKKFTAEDVNYNLKDVEIKPLGPFTLEFRLKEAFSPLPVLLSRPLFKKGLIGTGSYKVSSLKLNADRIDRISLTPVDEDAGLPMLVFRFYPTESAAVTGFKLGEVDILSELSDAYNFSSWNKIEIRKKVLQKQVMTIFFNQENPILSVKNIRQALNYAVPDLGVERAWGSISPASWAFSKDVKLYQPDLEKAKSLLKDEDLTASATSLNLSTFAPYLSIAQKIANSWEKLGIKVQVRVENTVPHDFDALLIAQEIPSDPDQYPLWHSTQTRTNLSNFKNVKIDKLLEDGRKTYHQEERKKIYADFQKYLADESPAAFLYYPTVYTISRK